MKRREVFISCILLVGLMLSGCASAPTAAPVAPAATTAPSAAPTAAPTPVATIPTDKLSQKGHLLICSDLPYPPQEFFDENGNPVGMEVDLGNEIGARLGLKVEFINSVFDTAIAAALSGKCDMVLSAMFITPDRNKQVSFIPYFEAGQSFVALKGNPDNINNPMDLCGKSAASCHRCRMEGIQPGSFRQRQWSHPAVRESGEETRQCGHHSKGFGCFPTIASG